MSTYDTCKLGSYYTSTTCCWLYFSGKKAPECTSTTSRNCKHYKWLVFHLVLIQIQFNSIKVTYGVWNISELVVGQVDNIECLDCTQLDRKCSDIIVCQ